MKGCCKSPCPEEENEISLFSADVRDTNREAMAFFFLKKIQKKSERILVLSSLCSLLQLDARVQTD